MTLENRKVHKLSQKQNIFRRKRN